MLSILSGDGVSLGMTFRFWCPWFRDKNSCITYMIQVCFRILIAFQLKKNNTQDRQGLPTPRKIAKTTFTIRQLLLSQNSLRVSMKYRDVLFKHSFCNVCVRKCYKTQLLNGQEYYCAHYSWVDTGEEHLRPALPIQ